MEYGKEQLNQNDIMALEEEFINAINTLPRYYMKFAVRNSLKILHSRIFYRDQHYLYHLKMIMTYADWMVITHFKKPSELKSLRKETIALALKQRANNKVFNQQIKEFLVK